MTKFFSVLSVAASALAFVYVWDGGRTSAHAQPGCVDVTDIKQMVGCLRHELGRTATSCTGPPPTLGQPVPGRRTLTFGQKTSFGWESKGIAVESSFGAAVSAPAAGFVLFADEFRSYGPIIIMDVGCGRDALIAGPLEIGVHKGDQVGRDARIATIAKRGEDLPVVYYELRQDGEAVDPESGR